MIRLRCLVLIMPLLGTACGNGGPSRSDVEAALNQPIKQMGGDPIIVATSSCEARDDGIYRCTVKASQSGMSAVHVIDFKQIGGAWTKVSIIR